MKKGLILLAAILLLVGCSKEKAADTTDNTNAAVTEGAQNVTGTDTTGTDTTGSNTSADSASGDATEGFSFTFNGVNIPMNVDAAPIIKALGDPATYFEAASCAFQGLDKIYTYSGFEINTYPNGDKDYVSTVYFLDDSVTTDKGICLGSTLEDVKAAYGEDCTEVSGEYTYTLGQSKLSFIIKDDSVTSITYKAVVDGLNN